MLQILVAVDEFTENHVERIRNAVREWALVRRVPHSADPERYRAELQDADAVVGWPDPQWLTLARLRLVQIGSSGWDAYEQSGLEDRGIALCSARGIYSIGVAEHCVAMMFALARRLPAHIHDQQQRVFRRRGPYGEIAGTTACIVGLGSIGIELASRCKGLRMTVIGVSRDGSQRLPDVEQNFPAAALETAIRQSDHVFMTASGGRRNSRLFTRKVLESFRPTTYFYNVSRGSTVDEGALCELLSKGKIAGAGLDVTQAEPLPADSPLWNLGDNVLITGHSAGISRHYLERFCDLAIRNLAKFHKGEPLENRVL